MNAYFLVDRLAVDAPQGRIHPRAEIPVRIARAGAREEAFTATVPPSG